MKFRTLIGLLVLLSVVGRRGCSAQANPCYGAGQRPLVNETAGNITGYSYTVDKAPPYKGSHERYAHERFLLNKAINVHIEHRGCPMFPQNKKRHVNVSFSISGKLNSREDTQFWVDRSLALIQSLNLCSDKRVSDWCKRLERARSEKLTYDVVPTNPYADGIWLTLEEGPEGDAILLVITVKQYDTHVDLNVGTAFVGSGD